jgi:hypothetical protein
VGGFRGDDASLERELALVRETARLRVRRVTRELAELDREAKALERERARRRALARLPAAEGAGAAARA